MGRWGSVRIHTVSSLHSLLFKYSRSLVVQFSTRSGSVRNSFQLGSDTAYHLKGWTRTWLDHFYFLFRFWVCVPTLHTPDQTAFLGAVSWSSVFSRSSMRKLWCCEAVWQSEYVSVKHQHPTHTCTSILVGTFIDIIQYIPEPLNHHN